MAVIDEDASVCRGLARLLRESGIHTIAYPSAEAFLLDRKRPSFDCPLLDVEMAVCSGLDLQERMVNSGGRMPMIFITASDDPVMRERSERLGCGAYLRKTVSGQELLQKIRRLISRK